MTSSDIKNKALALGYAGCGIIQAVEFDEYVRHLEERIAAFPDSAKAYENLYKLAVPPENSRSLIVCTKAYTQYRVPDGMDTYYGKYYLFDGRLPYTEEARARSEFEIYLTTSLRSVRNASVSARWAAARAGIGCFTRSNFIVDPKNGSYVWVETWAVDDELEYDTPPKSYIAPGCRSNCRKCIEACPTGALSSDYTMDRTKCIAHLTFGVNDIPAEGLRMQMGRWLYGCDACQDACPINKPWTGSVDFPLLVDHTPHLTPERILEMDEQQYLDIVHPRFWYIGKDSLWLWKCNALRAMVNSGEERYYPAIQKNCGNPDARVREMAEWGCRALGLDHKELRTKVEMLGF